jgi:hypothetical protein
VVTNFNQAWVSLNLIFLVTVCCHLKNFERY